MRDRYSSGETVQSTVTSVVERGRESMKGTICGTDRFWAAGVKDWGSCEWWEWCQVVSIQRRLGESRSCLYTATVRSRRHPIMFRISAVPCRDEPCSATAAAASSSSSCFCWLQLDLRGRAKLPSMALLAASMSSFPCVTERENKSPPSFTSGHGLQ